MPQQEQFEELDSLMVEGMKVPDKKWRKLKMGVVQWTPQVSENFETIRALRMLIKEKQVRMSIIRRTITKMALPKNVVTKSVHELLLSI